MTNAAELAQAVLNNLWQSAIVAVIVWLILRFARRLDAATRYAIWWIVLAAILIAPLLPRGTVLSPKAPALQTAAGPPATLARYRHLNPPTPFAPDAIVAIPQRRSSSWPQWLFAAWVAIAGMRLFQLARSYAWLRGLKRRAHVSLDPLPESPRSVRLLLSDDIPSPMAAGFAHPAIFIPSSLAAELTPSELDYVLLHEAAHIARRDDWANLVGRMLAAIFALDPVVLWILARIDHEREMACDDWVVARTGNTRPYAASLARICELSHVPLRAAVASGVFGGRSRIRERIETLLSRGGDFSPNARMTRVTLAGAAAIATIACFAPAPRWIALAQRPEFEVASIKIDDVLHADMDIVPRRSGDNIIMRNARLGSMIFYAYRLTSMFQLVADQKPQEWWEWYAVDAKAPATTSDDDLRLMFQSLLEDRFKLKFHRETREMGAYRLILAKGGPKLQPPSEKGVDSEVDGKSVHMRPGRCANLAGRDGFHLVCADAPISKLASDLMGSLRSPVVDETGIKGTYDFTLTYERMDGKGSPDVDSAPPVGEALKDLGLRLEKGKAPVEVLVVDHVEKPTGN
jgi:uncharacterized protein (TIGR03435 family)